MKPDINWTPIFLWTISKKIDILHATLDLGIEARALMLGLHHRHHITVEPRHGPTVIIRRPTSPIVPNYPINYAPHFKIHLIYPTNLIRTIHVRTRQTTITLIIITPIKEPIHKLSRKYSIVRFVSCIQHFLNHVFIWY